MLFILSTYLVVKSNAFLLRPTVLYIVLFMIFYGVGITLKTMEFHSISKEVLKFNLIPYFHLGAFSLGSWFCGRRYKAKFLIREWINRPNYFNRDSVFLYVNDIAVIVSLLLAILYFQKGIPLLAETKDIVRVQQIRGQGYFFVAIALFLPFFGLHGYYLARLNRNILRRIFYTAIIFVTLTLMISTLFKSPILRFMIILTMFKLISIKKPSVSFLRGIFLSLIGFLTLYLFIFITISDSHSAFNYLIKRVFTMNANDLYVVINLFPDQFNFLLGKGLLMDIAAIKPGPSISFNGWMYQIIYPFTNLEGGINASFASLWADFGWGYLPIYFCWGYYLEMFFVKYISKARTLTDDLFYSFYTFGLANTSAGLVPKLLEFVFPLALAYWTYKVVYTILRLGTKPQFRQIATHNS